MDDDERKKRKAGYQHRYREVNKEKIAERKRQWYQANEERVTESHRQWYAKNRKAGTVPTSDNTEALWGGTRQ